MSRSVSAPSSVTNTSPCWNGFIVPGSTFRYVSSFCIVTRSPRLDSSAPSELAVRPLPSEETTPPVTKTNFVGWELWRRRWEKEWSRSSDGRSTGTHRNTIGVRTPPGRPVRLPRPGRVRFGGEPDQQRHQQRRTGGGDGDAGVVDRP